MVFPVVMYGCESWTVMKTECQRIDGFELWCWRRLLRVPWTARRSNQSIKKETNHEYSLQVLMFNLKLHLIGKYFKSVWNSKNILNGLCYDKSYDKITDLCMGEKLRQS